MLLPQLSDQDLRTLREVGLEWRQVLGNPREWRDALPVDPELGGYPEAGGIRPTRFGRFVPVAGRNGRLEAVEATRAAEAPPSPAGRI